MAWLAEGGGTNMPPLGLGGPIGQTPISSPETNMAMAPGSISPEVNTILASPLADRLIGPIMEMQQMQKMAKTGDMVRTVLQSMAKQIISVDPKKASDLEQLAAKLIKLLPMPGGMPSPGAMQKDLGPSGTAGMPQFPPPAVGPPSAMPLGGNVV